MNVAALSDVMLAGSEMPSAIVGLREQVLPLLLMSRLAVHGERSGMELAFEAERFVAIPHVMGIILPMLNGMEMRGLLASRWVKVDDEPGSRPRKLYRLTECGRTECQAGLQELECMIGELRCQ